MRSNNAFERTVDWGPEWLTIRKSIDLATRASRHLLVGALASAFLSTILIVLALVPLRRGQRWAFWAYRLPVLGYGVPMFIVDATHVARENLLMTLLPQGLGLAVAAIGLALVAYALFATDGAYRYGDG